MLSIKHLENKLLQILNEYNMLPLEQQRELLVNIKDYLEEFNEYLNQRANKYTEDIIEASKEKCLIQDSLDQFKRKSIDPFLSDIENLNKKIAETDIVLIDEQIKKIDELIDIMNS